MSLEDIREQKKSKGLYIVIGLLLVGMAGFGSQFSGFTNTDPAALKLGDIEVSNSNFTDALNRNRQRYPEAKESIIRDVTLAQLRQSMALEQYLTTYALAASNASIDEAIRTNTNFFENGKFSKEVFKRYIRVEPQVYRNSLSKTISQQLFQNVFGSTAVVSDAEITPLIEANTLSRDILVAKVARDAFKNTADDKDIQSYYDEHKDEYMTDEEVNVEYIELNPDEIAASITVSDSDILVAAQPRNVKYYAFKNADDANSVRGDLRNAPADKIDDSGELSNLNATATADSPIPQAAIDAIFALAKKGDVTEVIDVGGTPHLFELTSEPKKALSDDEKVLAKAKLQKAQAAPKIAALNEQLNKAVFDTQSPDLATIAKDTGLKIKQTGLVSLFSGKDVLGVSDLVKAIQAGDKTLSKLQEPVTVGERIIIYRLTEVKAPKQKALADVKEAVKQAVITNKTNTQMKAAVDKLIADAKKDGLQAVADKAKYPTQAYDNFTGQVDEKGVLDPVSALFITQQPPVLGDENMKQIQSMAGDVFVYTNTAVRMGDTKNTLDAKAKAQISQQLMMGVAQLELGEFMRSISARADIQMRTGLLKDKE